MSRWHRTVDAGDVTLYGYVVGVDVLQMWTRIVSWLLNSFLEIGSREIPLCKNASSMIM